MKDTPCSCTALRKASRRITQLYDNALAPSGLKITQRAILAEIGRSGPTNVGKLAETLVMDPGALAHTLKPLKRDGLITAGVDPADRRIRLISLTEAGREKLMQSAAAWAQAQHAFDTAFSATRAEAMREAMRILASDAFSAGFEQALAEPAGAMTGGRFHPADMQ